MKASYISWTRSARRAKQRGEITPTSLAKAELGAVLTCTVSISSYDTPTVDTTEEDKMVEEAAVTGSARGDTAEVVMSRRVKLACSWVRGSDRQAFETFFNHLKTKITTYSRDLAANATREEGSTSTAVEMSG